MSDGADDNVKNLGKGKPTAKDLINSATAAVDKARKESFEAKIKDKVKLLQEQKRAVAQTELEIKQLGEEFESGI